MAVRRLVLSLTVVASMTALLVANAREDPASGVAMTRAAQEFLATLTPEQRDVATFAYDSEERTNWHFIPRERKGLVLRSLEGEARQTALKLLQSGLSNVGYDQALNIMSLEEILYLLEGGKREERRARRDPEKYYFSVFGEPGLKGRWGWRLEGHHLSLNYSLSDGEVISTTPEFYGANPGLVDAGPERTIRVLGPEEDLARQILKLATKEQQKTMWISKEAPDDLRGGGVAQPPTTDPVGLPAAKMNPDQKKLLRELLAEYLQNMPADVEKQRRTEINDAGMDNIHFAWWGSSELNERHYYRVQGPTFIVEYNNTQNSANHVHSMWRNLDGDFAIPLKKD